MDYHIKMETRTDGWARWLETESTEERIIIFEVFYDSEGVCRSEEIVGWIWSEGVFGETVTEDDIKEWAEKRSLKATYSL